ncbi:MAG: PIN domain-containing protein [Planctomycetota bacterium]
MSYLLDTNVISELRKGSRADSRVAAWFGEVPEDDLYLSVLVVGEIRRGVESVRRRDPEGGQALDVWLAKLCAVYEQRILPITRPVAEVWGLLNVPDPLPAIDGLLAATALVNDLVLVTRNVKDVAPSGVSCLDPFAAI